MCNRRFGVRNAITRNVCCRGRAKAPGISRTSPTPTSRDKRVRRGITLQKIEWREAGYSVQRLDKSNVHRTLHTIGRSGDERTGRIISGCGGGGTRKVPILLRLPSDAGRQDAWQHGISASHLCMSSRQPRGVSPCLHKASAPVSLHPHHGLIMRNGQYHALPAADPVEPTR
jgi:hypothetical protein